MMSRKEKALMMELVEWIEKYGEATGVNHRSPDPMLARARGAVRQDDRNYSTPRGKTLIEVLGGLPR
jgi:hypothetical protein